MSELKTYDFPVDHGDFTTTIEQFYLKSEADKVIAEKDEEIAGLKAIRKVHVEAIGSMGAGLLQDEEKILHHKYKRCLAMARWCASRSASWCFDPADDERHKSDFYEKWKLRWLELSEEPTWAKFLQLIRKEAK